MSHVATSPEQDALVRGALSGVLHALVAFDWGNEIDLAAAAKIVPSESLDLARRRRTPSSIAYHPAPLRFQIPDVIWTLPPLGPVTAIAEATLFDFGAASVAIRVPLELPPAQWSQVANSLAEPEPLLRALELALRPAFERLRPAIRQPHWSPLSEEYFVFEFAPAALRPAPAELLVRQAAWLAGLVTLDGHPLSAPQVAESLRLHLAYTPSDLLISEWAASVLVDVDCEETLRVVEFANVQLLEFRHVDNRLDDQLEQAYRLIAPLARGWLPFWRTQTRPLRALGEMRVEAAGLFERTGNVLKLVGDQYLSRVYRQLGTRFHLETWEKSIRQSLDVVQGVYEVVSDQAATYRTELLEVVIILLILFEVVMAFWRQ